MAEEKGIGVKMPVSYKDFKKEPVKALLFISLVAIGYLYIDLKIGYTQRYAKENAKVEKLEMKVEKLTEQIRVADSTLGGLSAQLTLLQKLGKIN